MAFRSASSRPAALIFAVCQIFLGNSGGFKTEDLLVGRSVRASAGWLQREALNLARCAIYNEQAVDLEIWGSLPRT